MTFLADHAETLAEAVSLGSTTIGQGMITHTVNAVQAKPLLSDELRAAVATGWRSGWSFLFDEPNKPLVSVLASHHIDAIKWHWASRHRLCRQQIRERQIETELEAAFGFTIQQQQRIIRKWREKQPRYMAYFPIWSRGHMKSTIARRMAVMDAVIMLYYGITAGYCLYFSGTDEKTAKHALSIDRLLRSQRIRDHAPLLAEVMRSDEREKDKAGRSMGWKATFFYTAAGYVYHFGSLQSGLAGGNVDDIRPTMLIPDDIDDRKDSALISEKNFKLLTTEILPMGAKGTLTFWAQNLITRHSSMYRINEGHSRVLVNRKKAKRIPACLDPVWEVQTIKGIVRDQLVGGTPTWKYFGIPEMQDEINRMGKPAFETECQHNVEQSREGLMIHSFDDNVHVISESEFESVFHTRKMPKRWPKQWVNDWARTKTAKHANVAIWQTVSAQNSPMPGFTFYFYPMSFVANSQPEDVAERVLSCLEPYANSMIRGTRLNPVTEKPSNEPQTWAELRRDELLRANALQHTTTSLDRIEFERAVLQEIIPKYSEPVLLENNVAGGVNSHERDDIRLLYNQVYALKCQGVNPGKFGGTEQLNRDFAVDYKEPHPFRPGILGYSRTFVVVPDDTDQPPHEITTTINGVERTVSVYPPAPYPEDLKPDELHDAPLYRYQMKNWRVIEAKITETGEKIDDPLKMNDDMGNCFVAGTLISTQHGEIPIENVNVGDYVWTRVGLRRVITVGMTRKQMPVSEITMSNGNVLCGTNEHPIYIKNQGFNPLQMLAKNDRLESLWQTTHVSRNPSASFTKALPSTGIPMQNNSPIGAISRRMWRVAKRATHIFMWKSGKMLMARFQKAMRFTTKITIPLIMTLPTWKPSLSPSIVANICARGLQPLKTLLIWPGFAYCPTITTGTEAMKDENGCRTDPFNSKRTSRYWPLSASNVASDSHRLLQKPNFAAKPVLSETGLRPPGGDNFRSFRRVALSAARIFKASALQNSAQQIVVKQILPKGVASVFNLEVEGQPEYYANGVLVHNCMQMLAVLGPLDNTALTVEEELEMLIAEKVPELIRGGVPTITSKSEQQQLEVARFFAEREVEEKHGEGVLDEEDDDDSGVDNWWN